MKLFQGDCLIHLKTLADNSVDSVVTDPPYGLKFMGKKWDYDVPSTEIWREVLRVLKPGGYLLSFGGTRTYHRMVVNIEDAGFEIRDQIQWLYGSGFPKSHNVSRNIDKIKVGGRPKIGTIKSSGMNKIQIDQGQQNYSKLEFDKFDDTPISDEAKQWQGFGTALKPANEPIVLARKPLSEKTVAANVLRWGCGGLNIDESRIGYASEQDKKLGQSARPSKTSNANEYALNHGGLEGFDRSDRSAIQGRFPANIILDETAAAMLDEQSGVLKSGAGQKNTRRSDGNVFAAYLPNETEFASSTGGASRFFYIAKSSKRERNAGMATAFQFTKEFKKVSSEEFVAQRSQNKRSQFLSPYTPEQLADYELYMTDDFVGYGLSPAKDLIGVFNNSSRSGAGKEAVIHGISKGAKTLDAMDGFLHEYYKKFGFKFKNADVWQDQYAPANWDYAQYGKPNIVYMQYPKSLSRDPSQIAARLEGVKNIHPTVKPIKLMEYLIKLVTPPNGIVLCPFMGSGTTGVAAKRLGFDFIGMELMEEYFEIASKRIANG